jgi:hypothetical protein
LTDENTVKSGHATSRAAAMSKVVWLIDKGRAKQAALSR